MDISQTSYQRLWEPTHLQTIGLSLVSGSVATIVVHPLEFLKTVVQYRASRLHAKDSVSRIRESTWMVFQEITSKRFGKEGFIEVYRGFATNMMAKLSYLTIRNFTYTLAYDWFESERHDQDLENSWKVALAGFSGGLAAYLTSPFSMIAIRQILDSQLKPERRRNYYDPSMALQDLKTRKILFKGSHFNALRHAGLNVTIAIPYNYLTETLFENFGYSKLTAPISLIISSFISSFLTIPIDNLRTSIMQADDHKSSFQIFRKVVQSQGGIRNLWVGFMAYYLGILTYATLTNGITTVFTDALKRKKALEQWQI